MAPPTSMRSLFLLTSFLNAASVHAAFWTVTSRYVRSIETSYYTYATSVDTYTYTATRTVSPHVTPTSTGIYSSSSYDRTYVDVATIFFYYSAGVVNDNDLLPTTTSFGASTSATTSIDFVMPVTYTAPTTCPSSFEWSTTTRVYIPSAVLDQVTPTSKATATPYVSRGYTIPAVETWFLSASAAPMTTSDDYYYSRYIASCTTPYSYATTTRASSGGGANSNNNENYTYCTIYGACGALRTWVIVVATLLPTLFVLGFLESYIWFRRLMIGKGCLRLGTASWFLISPWVACITRTQSARSKEDQKLLREKWDSVSAGRAFALWWKWGFRHRYPSELLGEYSRTSVGVPGQGWTGKPGQPGPYPPGPPPPGGYPPNGMAPMGYYPGMPQMQPGSPPPPQAYMPPQGYGVPQPYYNQNAVPMVPPQAPVSPVNEEGKTISSVSTTPVPNPAQPAPSEVPAVSPPREVATSTPAPLAEAQARSPVLPTQELATQHEGPGQAHTGHGAT